MKPSPVESARGDRPISSTRRHHIYGMVWVVLGMIFCLTTGYLAFGRIDGLIDSTSVYRHLTERGIAAEAKIMARSTSNGRAYKMSYMFHALDAELQPAWFAKNTPVTADTFQHLAGAAHVDILYDPLDPNASKIKLENKPPGAEQYVHAGVLVLLSMVGMTMVIRGVLITRRVN